MKIFTILAVLTMAWAANAGHFLESRALISRHSSVAVVYHRMIKVRRNVGIPPKTSRDATSCTDRGATAEITATTGPNGSIDWFNCGLEDAGGWNPPYLNMTNLVYKPLTPDGPFSVCRDLISTINMVAEELDLPPILIGAFALHESSCNPKEMGAGGEVGVMQLARENCGTDTVEECREPGFNIRTAARLFVKLLKENNGNLITSVGNYNGWRKGMTYNEATKAAKGPCCRCQNNCDYLHQYFNGWLQNINAYDPELRLGKYFNLDICNAEDKPK